MKIDLSDLDLNQSLDFLDHFNAALRSKNDFAMPISGSGKFTEKGHFVVLDDWIKANDERMIPVTWQILQSNDGHLLSIEAISDKDHKPLEFESITTSFLNEVLLSVVTGKKERIFRRNYFSAISGSNLPGEYWLPNFRFAPQFPDDKSKLISSERYLVIDQEVEAIDLWHANAVARERATLASAHLSLLTDVGLYEPVHEMRWFLRKEDSGLKQFRESTQHIDLNYPEKMPKKGEICSPVEFKGSVFDHNFIANNDFSCPVETRKILRGLRKTNPTHRMAFNNCARLYQLAITIGRYYPTVRISYECASIDAIVKTLGNKFSSFSDFVRKNIDEDVNYLLEIIHGKIRSAHWHSGQFALGETDHRIDFLTDPQKHIRFNILNESHRVIRSSIFNWVMENIVDDST